MIISREKVPDTNWKKYDSSIVEIIVLLWEKLNKQIT